MHYKYVWKQLINILLHVSIVDISLFSGVDCAEKNVEGLLLNDTGTKLSTITNMERPQNVKAKWKGNQFWAITASDLTQLEKQRAGDEVLLSLPISQTQKTTSSKQSSLKRKKSGNKRNKGRSSHKKSSSHLHQKTVPFSKFGKTKSTAFNTTTPITKSVPINSFHSSISKLNSTVKKDEVGKPPSKGVTFPSLDRSTIFADLGPYQDYFLEYQSEEDISEGSQTTPKSRITTQIDTSNTTDSSSNSSYASNSTQLQINFFPKTPVNTLYLLQAYASNMKPIKLQSPVLGGPSGEISPSIPVSVPVTLNPPNSPFLFNLDLDNFFTRMAISFFYSSIAIAPMVYLLIGRLGSLSGLSIVPFTGKKRRRKRDVSSHFEVDSSVEQIVEQIKLWMHEDNNNNNK